MLALLDEQCFFPRATDKCVLGGFIFDFYQLIPFLFLSFFLSFFRSFFLSFLLGFFFFFFVRFHPTSPHTPSQALIALPEKISRSPTVIEFLDANQLDIKPPSAEEREKKPVGILQKMMSVDEDKQRDPMDMQIGDGAFLSFFFGEE